MSPNPVAEFLSQLSNPKLNLTSDNLVDPFKKHVVLELERRGILCWLDPAMGFDYVRYWRFGVVKLEQLPKNLRSEFKKLGEIRV